jgi:hypothetical protein
MCLRNIGDPSGIREMTGAVWEAKKHLKELPVFWRWCIFLRKFPFCKTCWILHTAPPWHTRGLASGCWHPSSTDSWNDVSHTKTCTVKLDHQLEHLKCLMFHVFFWLATRFDYLIIFGWSGGVPNTVREQHHVLVCLGEFCRLKSPIEWSIYPLVI